MTLWRGFARWFHGPETAIYDVAPTIEIWRKRAETLRVRRQASVSDLNDALTALDSLGSRDEKPTARVFVRLTLVSLARAQGVRYDPVTGRFV